MSMQCLCIPDDEVEQVVKLWAIGSVCHSSLGYVIVGDKGMEKEVVVPDSLVNVGLLALDSKYLVHGLLHLLPLEIP